MNLLPTLTQAVTCSAAVFRGVKPEQLGAPTPCQEWDVRALANHLLQVVSALGGAGGGQAVPDELWGRDLMTDGWAERFDEQASQALDAWNEPAAWRSTPAMGGAEMPAQLVVTMLASDLVIHAWDLARATGQDFHCDEAAAELTHRFTADSAEQGRQMGIYGPPRPVAQDASPLDRALAASGRDPLWTPQDR
ncbi:TIGR03086 family protein [Nonomuraea sp. NN258]|uniref:TIGR03086 family metal-binding protein n=1 Tax=Nonomuraea antri TaxID=2730852 RepID=UPI001569B38C|nr:TIGR03086 family metal-binding protein [Nonomuraea antri]NRQ31850.1 TIGR03086 family protein [Nonomuraea antri]